MSRRVTAYISSDMSRKPQLQTKMKEINQETE